MRMQRAGIGVLLLFGGALAMRLASTSSANASFIVLAIYALCGRTQAIQALALSWLFIMLSPGIAPELGEAALGRYAVLFAAAVSVFLRGRGKRKGLSTRPLVSWTYLLGLFLIVHSLVFSPEPAVSILKATAWLVAAVTSIVGWLGLRDGERIQLSRQLFAGLILILAISLPLTVLPVGYLRNGTGFQGILNHPQAFGLTVALLGAWAAARMFGEPRPAWWLIALVGVCIEVAVVTESRTAVFSLILGTGLSVMFSPVFAGEPLARLVPGLRSPRIWALLGLVVLIGIAIAPKVGSMYEFLLSKSGREDVGSLSGAYVRSRGIKIAEMELNIANHPFTGIGFGIASDPSDMIVVRDPIFGLPVSAAVEKGVMPLAVLEELGIFGAALVGLWVLLLLRGCARGGLAPFAVSLTVMLLNMGEYTLFSPGSMGLLALVLLGWSYASGQASAR